MIRNLKVLGLALVPVMALTAVAASSASALTAFTSEKAPVQLTATQEGNHVFDAAGNFITCKKASFSGTSSSTSVATITFSGTYSECTFFGVAVTVNMNGCAYVFHANGEVDVECPTGKSIIFKATILGSFCEVSVGPQNGLKTATYANIGTETTREVTMTPNITSIAYTANGGLCKEVGSLKNGAYTSGPTRITGETDPGSTHIGVFLS